MPEPEQPDPTPATRVVAVFDFDKTLSTRDNVLPFLAACVGRGAALRTLLGASPRVLRGDRDTIKARLAALLAGLDEDEVRHVAGEFADDVIAHHLRHDVVARARWHQDQGHDLAIVSASFAVYLEPVARHLRIDTVLATALEVVDGRLTGALEGPNVRRSEKVRRLDTWIGDAPTHLWAYGDSAGDRELLARADVAVRVGRRPITPAPEEPRSASGTGRVAR